MRCLKTYEVYWHPPKPKIGDWIFSPTIYTMYGIQDKLNDFIQKNIGQIVHYDNNDHIYMVRYNISKLEDKSELEGYGDDYDRKKQTIDVLVDDYNIKYWDANKNELEKFLNAKPEIDKYNL